MSDDSVVETEQKAEKRKKANVLAAVRRIKLAYANTGPIFFFFGCFGALEHAQARNADKRRSRKISGAGNARNVTCEGFSLFLSFHASENRSVE